jgi:cell wall-associated NlpC family hydrolase
MPADRPGSAANPRLANGDDLVRRALALRGSPYRNGGADPSGFDCSGFVHYLFVGYGWLLPRSVSDLYLMGGKVDRDEIRPGDLVFFTTVARGASHVGIAVGGGAFIHAPSSRGVVRVERLEASYWDRRFVGARRLTD